MKNKHITDEVVSAFKAGDYLALHRALGLAPHQCSPLPDTITALGVSQDPPPDWMTDERERSDWRNAQMLQAQLLRLVGWPKCRAAYRHNLAEALVWWRYCRSLVEHPEYGGHGTGSDLASRRRSLKKAEADVTYRRKLLAGLKAA